MKPLIVFIFFFLFFNINACLQHKARLNFTKDPHWYYRLFTRNVKRGPYNAKVSKTGNVILTKNKQKILVGLPQYDFLEDEYKFKIVSLRLRDEKVLALTHNDKEVEWEIPKHKK